MFSCLSCNNNKNKTTKLWKFLCCPEVWPTFKQWNQTLFPVSITCEVAARTLGDADTCCTGTNRGWCTRHCSYQVRGEITAHEKRVIRQASQCLSRAVEAQVTLGERVGLRTTHGSEPKKGRDFWGAGFCESVSQGTGFCWHPAEESFFATLLLVSWLRFINHNRHLNTCSNVSWFLLWGKVIFSCLLDSEARLLMDISIGHRCVLGSQWNVCRQSFLFRFYLQNSIRNIAA